MSDTSTPATRSRRVLDDWVPSGDYRLVLPAVTVWITTLTCLLAPPPTTRVVVMVCVAGGAAGAVALWRRWARWTTISFVVVVAGMGVVTAGALAVRLEARSAHPLWQADGKARIVGIIRDDAVAVGPAVASMVRVRVDVTEVADRPTAPMGAELTGSAAMWSDLLPGQRFSVLVRVRPPRDGDLLVARLGAVGTLQTLGRPPPHQRLAGAVRVRLQLISARALGPEAGGLFPGLVLGDTSSLDTQVRDDFRAAGLSHLIAVSGQTVELGTYYSVSHIPIESNIGFGESSPDVVPFSLGPD